MEAIMTSGFTDEVLSESAPAYSGFTGTTPPQELFETTKRDLPFGIREKIAHRHLREARQQRRYWASLDIVAESADNEQIFDVIQSLYLSENRPRDRQIATRITARYCWRTHFNPKADVSACDVPGSSGFKEVVDGVKFTTFPRISW
jgi:hypothetical protein